MVYWNRFISYIYRYHDGRKCENSGFAKVAKTGRTGRITIGLKNGISGRETIYNVYIYRETLPRNEVEYEVEYESEHGSEKQMEQQVTMLPLPVLIGKMKLCNGHGEETFSFCWDNVGESGRPITAFAGIAIRPVDKVADSNSHCYESDMFCSSWTDSRVDYSRMWTPEQIVNNGALEEAVREVSITDDMTAGESETVEECCRDEGEHITLTSASDTMSAVDSMFQKYERLPLLPASSLDDGLGSVIESVKITPNDIGLLDMNNWKLGVNSFLTHGYYSYKYLMLGKVIFKPEESEDTQAENNSYILGVPGVYSAREKYLAGIFGFDRFVPERETHIKTGNFGYWIVDIV